MKNKDIEKNDKDTQISYNTKNWKMTTIHEADEYDPNKKVFVRHELDNNFDYKNYKTGNNIYKGFHPDNVIHITIPKKEKNLKVKCTVRSLWDTVVENYHFIPIKTTNANIKESELKEINRLKDIGRYIEPEFNPETYINEQLLNIELLNIKGLGQKFIRIEGKKVFDPEIRGGVFVLDGDGQPRKVESLIKGINTENFYEIKFSNGESIKVTDNVGILNNNGKYKNVKDLKIGNQIVTNHINHKTHTNSGGITTITDIIPLGIQSQEFYQIIFVNNKKSDFDKICMNNIPCSRIK